MSSLLQSALPLVAAPMAGGPSSTTLVGAVMAAGGFGFLAGGYKSPAAMKAEIDAVRSYGDCFGVNLFVPTDRPVVADAYSAYANELRADAEELGVELPTEPVSDDDGWGAKLDELTSHPVPVVSFTFGLPAVADIAALRSEGTVVLATVTTAAEARQAHSVGVDGLIVQGPRAGGHSATFEPDRSIGDSSTAEALEAARAASLLPLIGAGGVAGPECVRQLIAVGAEAVAVGTLLLLSDEAGTNATHRSALTDPAFTDTVITKAYTGRPARSLRNDFIWRHDAAAITGYPAVHHLTQPLRRAATAAGDAQRLHLWVGTGFRSADAKPTRQIIDQLSAAL